MTRRTDWWERLEECVLSHRETAFSWGVTDCVLFAADCVAAMTGEDLAAAARGSYDDAAGAARALQGLGAADVGELLAQHFVEIPVAMAQRGDVVAVELEGRLAAGVAIGADLVGIGDCGLVVRPLTSAARAFRVD